MGIVTSDSDVVTSETPGREQAHMESAGVEQLGRGHREPRRSGRLSDYVTYSARCRETAPHAAHPSDIESSGAISYPLANYLTCTRFSYKHCAPSQY